MLLALGERDLIYHFDDAFVLAASLTASNS